MMTPSVVLGANAASAPPVSAPSPERAGLDALGACEV